MKLEFTEIKATAANTAEHSSALVGGPLAGTEFALIKEIVAANADMVALSGATAPWVGYLCKRDGEAVGCCAFKGPPNDGVVEIAYYTFPRYRGQGVAKQMASELLRIACASGVTTTVVAHTLPERNSSTSVLLANGFTYVSEATDDEIGTVWAWSKICSAANLEQA